MKRHLTEMRCKLIVHFSLCNVTHCASIKNISFFY
jgi:hypothetical protein